MALFSGRFMHRLFQLQIQRKRSCDDKHLLVQMTTVCSTAVANSLKVPTSRQILPMRFASLKLFSVAYLELYLGRKFKAQKIENKLLSTFPYSVGTKTWQLRDAKRDIIETGFNQSSEHEASSSRRENVKCIVMWISWWIINALKVSWCQGIIATTARDSLLTQSGNLSSHKLLFWIHKRNQQCMQPLEKKKKKMPFQQNVWDQWYYMPLTKN